MRAGTILAGSKNERYGLAAAAGLSLAIGLVYAYVLRDHALSGDERYYDAVGRLAADGHWFWGLLPFGHPHPTVQKPPAYPAWIGFWYTVLGTSPARLAAVQALLGPLVVVLTWLLAVRLTDDRRVALVAAFVVALYPMAWQFQGLLYPEALAAPVTVAALAVGLGRDPTPRRAAVVGLLVGLGMLIRQPFAVLLVALVAGWLVRVGLRRTVVVGAIAVACTLIPLVPWLARNHHLTGRFLISTQDQAMAGTFNATSAGDPDHPYAWRESEPRDAALLRGQPRQLSEVALRDELRSRAVDFIEDHPDSVPKAFYWNGVTRFWDLRTPSRSMEDVKATGRPRSIAISGLVLYYPMLLLALAGLWRMRRRWDVVVTLLVLALGSTVAYSVVAVTRYRSPFEPVLVVLACSAAVPFLRARLPSQRMST